MSLLLSLLLSLLWISAHAAKPVWTIIPAPGSNPTQTVLENETTNVLYVVNNQSVKPKRLVIQPVPGISQITPCQLASKGQIGDTCTLNLAINGSALAKNGVHGGPILCEANLDNTPNPNQCYQPSAVNSLNITRGSVIQAAISVNPSTLSFVAGNNGFVTVTNNIGSPVAANNINATIPGGSNISIQSMTCGSSLAIGASCTITFTASVAEGPTNVVINGSNTNNTNVDVTVTPVPIATIDVNPTTLLFAENSTGNVTVTNNAGSAVAANNIGATIPGGSNITVQNTTCGASLAIGASCTITFTSNAQEGPTSVSIAGDNTNTVNTDITVTSQPQISITSPTQQNRVVPVAGAPLTLEITNGGSVNADAVTISDKTGCPALTISNNTCTSVPPAGTCTLLLTSSTPYAPCMITVSGSNTTNNPTTLIAFSYLGGLVFEESGGSGKIVDEINDTSLWTNSFSNIAGAVSSDDGVANTDAIVLDGACTVAGNCAAKTCRDIGSEWYLPAVNELSSIHGSLCSNNAIPCNFGSFSSGFYWSSTQVTSVSANNVNFPLGFQLPDSKSTGLRVRCVREFS